MKNPMERVKPSSIDIIGPRAVLFTIELAFNAHLRDEEVLKVSMDSYMNQYPNIEGYQGETKGDVLYLVVYGKINHSAAYRHTS